MTNPHPASRNYQKHTSANPLQRWLLDRFHEKVIGLAAGVLPTEGTVLDVGCGEGFVAGLLAKRLPDMRLLGLDGSLDAVRVATASVPPAAFSVADAGLLPVASRSVELALCLEVLEHLYDPDLTLSELARVTHGPVIVSTPNQPFFAGANLARLKNLPTLGDDPEHVQWWTGQDFVRVVSRHLTVERVVYSLPWTIVVARRA